jgi:collagenase-like PrtC family protease
MPFTVQNRSCKVGTEETGECFDAEEDSSGVYLLNSRDLCTIDILPDILKTGLNSLKSRAETRVFIMCQL